MNSREILEYSRQLVAAKTEIETAQKAEPDLEDQVKTKFREDTVNRARFVDATLVIGAATKEFRNVFGVDAPHYELSDKCYLAVDRNGDGRYITSFDKNNYPIFDEGDGPIYVEDPMGQDETTRYYLDCWELANAARFDSTLMCSNYFGDNGNELFVNKQKFFVDNKKDSESSAAHNPICPPGYDKWAGNKIYNYICKCFDLDELNLFRLLGNKNIQTIPYTFEIKANGDDKFECNINEDGIITKNIFNYEFPNSDIAAIEASNKGDALLPESSCIPKDLAPVKWYTYRVPDIVRKVGDKWCHNLQLQNSPFAKSDLALVSFELIDSSVDGMMKSFLESFKKKEQPTVAFNDGFAILTRNQSQSLPSESERGQGYFDIQYSVNIIWRRNTNEGNLDRGDTETYTKPKKFLWWTVGEKTVVKKKPYRVVFSPINKNVIPLNPWNPNVNNKALPANVMSNLARFIYRMEDESLKYYKWIEERKINITIPNQELAIETASDLKNSAYSCYINPVISNWTRMIRDLRIKVCFDLLERKPYNTDPEFDRITNFEQTVSKNATAQYNGSSTYISSWYSNWIPSWPRFLRRLLKRWSTPIYTSYGRYTINIENVETCFLTSRRESQIVLKQQYFGPSSGDLTRGGNHMLTPPQLLSLLTADQKTALSNGGILRNGSLVINGQTLSNSAKYEFIINQKNVKGPSYNEIKRATTLNSFLKNNGTFYFDAFSTLSDRINKRTGTLRKTYSILESTNINAQMIAQRERNLAHLFKYLNAYEITGGFGTNIATIKLAAWEPSTSAYANLPRLSTVYILADNTTLDKNRENFEYNFVKTTIMEIIDKMSDTIYSYKLTEDPVVDEEKTYYVYNEATEQYEVANSEQKVTENIANLYEQNPYATIGPIFKVTLSDPIPETVKGRNPRLVKVY